VKRSSQDRNTKRKVNLDKLRGPCSGHSDGDPHQNFRVGTALRKPTGRRGLVGEFDYEVSADCDGLNKGLVFLGVQTYKLRPPLKLNITLRVAATIDSPSSPCRHCEVESSTAVP